MAWGCKPIAGLLTSDCQLQGDHRTVSPILCHGASSDKIVDMPDIPTLALLPLGHIKASTPPAC